MADQLARYDSPPESLAVWREKMREVKEALTKDARGRFPASYAAMDWDGLNMQPPEAAWQDMDAGQRYDLLRHVLDESIWSLEPPANWNEPSDCQKLALEFVKEDARQSMPGFRADTFDALLDGKGSYLRDDQPVRESDEQRIERQKEIISSGAYFPEGWEAPHLTAPPVSSDAGAVDRARTQVEALKAADFFSGPGQHRGWDDLPEWAKFNTLRHWVDWDGVSQAHRTQLIGRQLDAYELAVLHIPEHQYREAIDLPELIATARALAAEHRRDGMPTPQEWRKLEAEWTHDYGLRRLEERGIRYEDEAGRPPGHAGDTMPDVRADVLDGLMTRLEAFGDEFARLARTKQQKALAEAFGELVGEVHTSIVYIAEATRRYGPAGVGPGEPTAADHVTSPADLVEGDGGPSQKLTRGRSVTM